MGVTIRDLLNLPGLGLGVVAGKEGLDRSIRWAHTSELQDPTPWLSGGELLLTTGMGLKGSPALQRAYIRRLVQAGLAGLGFGVGFDFDEVPAAIVKAADREGFPVLEVPYPVPFLAIAEAISSRLTDDRVKDAQMSVEVHEGLAALVADGAGPADVLDEVVSLAGGWAILFDSRGSVLASTRAGELDPKNVWERLPDGLRNGTGARTTSDVGPHGTSAGMAVMSGKRHEGVLVFGREHRLYARERLVVHHAVTVLGLLLASRRAVIEAERRVAGDMLNEAFAGRLSGAELERRLELAGFSKGAPLAALVIEGPSEHDAVALDELAWAADSSLGARASGVRTTVVAGRVAAVMAHPSPLEVAHDVVAELSAGVGDAGIRIGVGDAVAMDSIRQSYLTALFALRAAPGVEVASPRDLGSYGLLLGSQPRPVLEGFVRAVLGPLLDRDEERSSELVPSVRAFVEAGGRWEPGADVLGVHRHTLRYRIRQAEELLGRDLSSTEDQLEVWLAMKASDILAE
ncbi:MAG TPA: PucR family transcriptional regulator ligand-binding domain-containing protein [Actinomycetota bacterium]